MSLGALARTIGGVKVNWVERSRPRLLVLAHYLLRIFQNKCSSHDTIAEFEEAAVLSMILDALKMIEEYNGFGEDATKQFEWRLQRYLHRLRL